MISINLNAKTITAGNVSTRGIYARAVAHWMRSPLCIGDPPLCLNFENQTITVAPGWSLRVAERGRWLEVRTSS